MSQGQGFLTKRKTHISLQDNVPYTRKVHQLWQGRGLSVLFWLGAGEERPARHPGAGQVRLQGLGAVRKALELCKSHGTRQSGVIQPADWNDSFEIYKWEPSPEASSAITSRCFYIEVKIRRNTRQQIYNYTLDTGMECIFRIFQVSPAGVHVASLSAIGSLNFSLYEVLNYMDCCLFKFTDIVYLFSYFVTYPSSPSQNFL